VNIIIQIPQLIFGGAEKVLVSFANELVARGHQVTVLETYEKGLLADQFDSRVQFDAICSKAYTAKHYATPAQVRKNPLKIFKWGLCKLRGYRKYAEKLAAIRYVNQEFDVAINYLEIDSPAFLLNAIRAKKYLQWIHTDVANLDDPTQYDHYLPLWQRMNHIVCVSKDALLHFTQHYPSLKNKTHLIYNFYDTEAVMEKGSVPYAFEGAKPTLLSVGRMTEPKQYLRFLDVLAQLRDEGFDFSWHVLGDGAQRQAIEEKIQHLDLSDRVFLHGLTDNPYKFMKNCDLFVLPSGWEGFPTVTVEAKILGCAVLATDVAGIREQLTHGKTGWIVDNSEDAIYEGLKYLLQNPDAVEVLRSNEGMGSICKNERKHRLFIELAEGRYTQGDWNEGNCHCT
jgi:glycosyltransferase involved in cell wall biosynthesis